MELSYAGAFLMGLFGALHCVGMCGSIIGVLTFSLPNSTREDPLRLVAYQGYYSLGRLLSYALAGALAGAFGSGLLFRLSPQEGHHVLLLAATLLMIAVGSYLAGWFPGLAQIEKLGRPLWKRLEPIGRRLLPVTSPSQALLYGLIWGWLPCGLVYSALFIAMSQGSYLRGSLFMLIFGLGTLPSVILTGIFAERLLALGRNPRLRLIAGLLLIGFALTGLILNW